MLDIIPRDSRPTLTVSATPWPVVENQAPPNRTLDTFAFAPLSRSDRLRLLDFAIAFVWADLRLTAEERTFVFDLAHAMNLSPRDLEDVAERLEMPPTADSVDPARVPDAQRPIVREIAERAFAADGVLSNEEIEQAVLLEELFAY